MKVFPKAQVHFEMLSHLQNPLQGETLHTECFRLAFTSEYFPAFYGRVDSEGQSGVSRGPAQAFSYTAA